MERRSRLLYVVFLAWVASTGLAAAPSLAETATVSLPAVFGDHMVLQRGMRVPVWGSGASGDEITVSIAGHQKSTTVSDDGSWRVTLDPMPAGGPHELVIEGAQTVRFTDVLVGEVWLASGQSNMEMPLAGWGEILDFEIEIARADYPEIRLFKVDRATANQPLEDVSSDGWRRCSPEAVAEFSSTAYFFARRVHRETGIPIGLISSSWGGTVAEAWTSASTLEQMADFRDAVRKIRGLSEAETEIMRREFEAAMTERNRAVREDDAGLIDGFPAWAVPDLEDSGWPTMTLPDKWEDAALPELDGVVWFRREVDLPDDWAGSPLEISLGPIDDADETYFNGELAGKTEGWDTPRHYAIPGDRVEAGRNVIAVRVLDTYLSGGLWGEDADLVLTGPSGRSIRLAGPWLYHVGLELEPLPPSPDDPNRPTVLYNGMIEPLVPYAIRGVIWYQGESNSSRAYQYRKLFRGLIEDWRSTWGQGNFPFYFVQLAGFEPGPLEQGKWPELREAQALALSLPATGMAVAIDIGNERDVHPKNKQEVGNRLARLALNRLYGVQVADSGPSYGGMSREDAKIRVSFNDADGGLEARGGALRGFTIAGADREFHVAEARIERGSVVVWSEDVAFPVAVRYGWEDYSDCNLYNAASLPALPFRTDDWPGLTEEAR
jgi:sialate O-acetylesterase